eukprot:TRINITY_DN13891_c0_g2_i1.p1 TRINITY_DN13891_c0_g2~~TRINITY_DN13891_c0_g2_i1.p1  ORF type:complete len:484 (-),score=107.49 TRINITY_DN13891_c0_g2_i1:544-1995(-)
MATLCRGHPTEEAGFRKLHRRNRGRVSAIVAALGAAAVFSAKVPECFSTPGARVLTQLSKQNCRMPSCSTNLRDLSLVAMRAGKFDAMKVAELKELCAEKGLKASGKKAFLVARLEEAEIGSSSSHEADEEVEEKEAEDTESSSDEGIFKAGQLALAKFHHNGRYYTVTLVKDNGNGTWVIRWASDGNEDTADVKDLKPQRSYKVGDYVVAKCASDGIMYTGRVKNNNGDGTLDLVWLDDYEETVQLDDTFPQLKKFKVGQAVEAKFRDDGIFYGAKIAKDLGKFKYAVEWDEDGDGLTELTIDELRAPRVDVATFKVGQQLEGIVKTVTSFGAFVDVGAWSNGLVHISHMTENGIAKNPEDYVRENDEITVWVRSVDSQQQRLTLTMVENKMRWVPPPPRTWTHPMKELTVGQELQGTVSGVKPYGVFVDVGSDKDGLVHNFQNIGYYAKLGKEVSVWVTSLDDGELGLSFLKPIQYSALVD